MNCRRPTALSVALALLLSGRAFAAPPAVDIPGEIRPAGQYVMLLPKTDAAAITYVGLSGVEPIPSVVLKDPRMFLLDTRGLVTGRYKFTAVASLKDEHNRVDFAVVVGTPPTPTPTPTPEPQPNPAPPPPIVEKLGFTTLARDAVAKLPANERVKAPAVAENFEGTGSKLAAGGFPGADPIGAANFELVAKHRAVIGGPGTPSRDQYWLPTFFQPWQAKADALGRTGDLLKPEDYVQAYSETAAGLRLSAEGLPRVGP